MSRSYNDELCRPAEVTIRRNNCYQAEFHLFFIPIPARKQKKNGLRRARGIHWSFFILFYLFLLFCQWGGRRSHFRSYFRSHFRSDFRGHRRGHHRGHRRGEPAGRGWRQPAGQSVSQPVSHSAQTASQPGHASCLTTVKKLFKTK